MPVIEELMMIETVADTSYAMDDDWQRAWEPTIAAIGRDFGGDSARTAVDEVELGAIRRYCEPLEYDCPLHYDEAIAKSYGYRGIVAPYSGTSSIWIDTALWEPGLPTNFPSADPNYNSMRHETSEGGRPPAPATTTGFATDLEVEYFEPVYVGDRLTVLGNKLLSVTPRETSVGRGAFMVQEQQIHNQRRELVAMVRRGNYAYVPKPKGATAERPAAPPTTGPIMEAATPREPLPEPRRVDWSKQITYRDVNEGDEVPPIVFNLTIYRFVVYAGAVRMFGQMHHNTGYAQSQGAPDIYAGMSFIQGVWECTVGEYIGLAGRVKKVGPLRLKTFSNVGESLIAKGVVKRKWIEGDEHLVELELWCEHSRGTSAGPGPVVVVLPSGA